jgi:hypothetical protein
MTLKALQKKYKNKRKQKSRTKMTIQSKHMREFHKPSSCCSRQHCISHRPNLGIHYPPRSSSSKPLSRDLRPTSVGRRN